jgi:cystathionine beta-lyase
MTRHARVATVGSRMRYKNGRYEIDWDDLEAKMTPDVRAMIVCNPQNPTSNVWTEEELLRVGRFCLEHKIVVLFDEIHCEVVRPGHRYVPIASLPDKAVVNHSVSSNAISKTFNLAGMKNGYYYSKNPQLLGRVDAFHRADLSTLGVVANIAAYRNGRKWFDQANTYMDESHTYIENYLKQHIPSVGYSRNEGTYMTFWDVDRVMAAIGAESECKAQGKETPESCFQDWLVYHSGVYPNPGSEYGAGGEGHMRMNIASLRLVLRDLLDAMAGAINDAV